MRISATLAAALVLCGGVHLAYASSVDTFVTAAILSTGGQPVPDGARGFNVYMWDGRNAAKICVAGCDNPLPIQTAESRIVLTPDSAGFDQVASILTDGIDSPFGIGFNVVAADGTVIQAAPVGLSLESSHFSGDSLYRRTIDQLSFRLVSLHRNGVIGGYVFFEVFGSPQGNVMCEPIRMAGEIEWAHAYLLGQLDVQLGNQTTRGSISLRHGSGPPKVTNLEHYWTTTEIEIEAFGTFTAVGESLLAFPPFPNENNGTFRLTGGSQAFHQASGEISYTAYPLGDPPVSLPGGPRYLHRWEAKGTICGPNVPMSGPLVPPGLVAAYSFDEGTGAVAHDSSGNANHGALVNDPTWFNGTGRFGGALRFDGVDDLVEVVSSASLEPTDAITVEAWVYPEIAEGGWRTVALKETSRGLSYALYASDAVHRPSGYFRIDDSELPVPSTNRLPLNTWSHVATTYDGSHMRVFVNGVLVHSTSRNGVIEPSGAPLRIGGNSVWGEYFKGAIDELRLYNIALTEREIQADMLRSLTWQSAPPVPSDSLVAAYAFDDQHGEVLFDSSGHGNHGVMIGPIGPIRTLIRDDLGHFQEAMISGPIGWIGTHGSALRFDGVDDYVAIPSSENLNLSAGLTIEAQVRPTEALNGWRTVVLKESPSGLDYALYANDVRPQPSAYVRVDGADRNVQGDAGPVPVNRWTHLAMTFDGDELRLYTNGVLVGRTIQHGDIATSDGQLAIGGNTVWGEYFAGLLDDVRVYSRPLSIAEIQTNMTTPVKANVRTPVTKAITPEDFGTLAKREEFTSIPHSASHEPLVLNGVTYTGEFGQLRLDDFGAANTFGLALATSATDTEYIDVLFNRSVLRAGAWIGLSDAALTFYDEAGGVLQTLLVQHTDAPAFVGLESDVPIRRMRIREPNQIGSS
jgi:Concanavalin A-like lectin/glucanases superfamily